MLASGIYCILNKKTGQGKVPDGKLKRRKGYAGVHPSRFTCTCGQMKSLGSRWCLTCAKAKVQEMIEAGYLPADTATLTLN